MAGNQWIQTNQYKHFSGTCNICPLPTADSGKCWLRQTVNTPARTFGVVRSGWGSLPKEIFEPTENCCPPRPISKKILPLYSWRPLDYKSHIECTSSSRFKIQYIYAFPISKYGIDWDVILVVNPSTNHILKLEVQKFTKSSLTSRL